MPFAGMRGLDGGTGIELNALDVANLFRVFDAENTHPVVLQIIFENSAAGELRLAWDREKQIDLASLPLVLGDANQRAFHHNIVILNVATADETKTISSALGIDIFKRLVLEAAGGGAGDVIFEYALAEGGMDFSDINAQLLGEIVQLQKVIPGGDPYHQPGPIRQIGGIGPLNP